MPRKKKASKDKRLKVDVWVTDGLRAAVGQLLRDDGKPANDEQVRLWAQGQIDSASVREVDTFDTHRKAAKRRRGQ
jgi:hypothetical protein